MVTSKSNGRQPTAAAIRRRNAAAAAAAKRRRESAGQDAGAAAVSDAAADVALVELVDRLPQGADVTAAAGLDAERLDLEADQVAADYAPAPADAAAAAVDPNAPPVISTEDAEKGYRMLALAVVGQSCLLFVPAWRVSIEEQTTVSDAMVQALLLWFPDGLIPAKYLALLVLASAVGTVALSRIDPKTGELPPRHAPVEKSIPVAPAGAATGNAATHIQPPPH